MEDKFHIECSHTLSELTTKNFEAYCCGLILAFEMPDSEMKKDLAMALKEENITNIDNLMLCGFLQQISFQGEFTFCPVNVVFEEKVLTIIVGLYEKFLIKTYGNSSKAKTSSLIFFIENVIAKTIPSQVLLSNHKDKSKIKMTEEQIENQKEVGAVHTVFLENISIEEEEGQIIIGCSSSYYSRDVEV